MTDLDAAKNALFSEGIGSPRVEAMVEAMFLAATSDGELAPEESLQFRATLEALTDRTFPSEAVAALLQRCAERVKADGRAARLAAIAARLPRLEARETTLRLAAAITASDAELQDAENDLLSDLADALQIPADRAVELVTRVHRL